MRVGRVTNYMRASLHLAALKLRMGGRMKGRCRTMMMKIREPAQTVCLWRIVFEFSEVSGVMDLDMISRLSMGKVACKIWLPRESQAL